MHSSTFNPTQEIRSHSTLVVLAVNLPDDLTAKVHLAINKFLANVAQAMSEKYH